MIAVDSIAVAILKGVVNSEAGAPVSGAAVSAAIENSVSGLTWHQSLGTSNDLGQFGGQLGMPLTPEVLAWVTVTVTPPASSGLATATVTIPSLRFRPEGVPDTAEITVTLAAAGQ